MKKLNIFLCLVLLCFNCAFAAENLSINTLSNGQKVIIKEIKDNNIVKIDTWINTGSINETDKQTGLSHFLEHLFFKGTTKYPTGTADKILDSKGAMVNAATSKDYTHYYIEIPSKDFDLALEIHADMLLNPMIPRKELERERHVVIEEISKTKDSPTNRLFDNLYSIIYSKSNHPYKRNVIGTKDVIDTVSRQEILDYYNKFYTPDAFTTVIVGDVDASSALKKVEAAFIKENTEGIKNKKQTKINYPKVKPITKIERKVEPMDINKTHIMLGFLAPKFDLPKDNYALDTLSTMLSHGKSSILNQDLKEKKELVLSINSGNYSQKDSGLFYIYATVDPNKENIENNVEQNIIKEIKKIQTGDFDEKMLTKAKNQIKTDTYYARESIDNISDELGYMFTFSSDINYYENYLKNIDKVTKQDIIKVANKYLTTDKYAVSIVQGNSDKKEKPVSNVETIKKPLGEFKLLEENGTTKKVLLDNGITLITKQKNANSIVAIDISIKGSKMVEKKPLTAMLSAALATKGTKNYTNKEFAEFLDENGIKLGLTGGNDTYSILIQTTKDNLDKAFIALDEVLNNPLFNENELEKIVTRKKQELKGISDSPSSFVFDEFKALSYPNTIYGQNSKFILDNIDKVKRDDIVEFYKRIIDPQNMIISVVGDVTTADIADKLNSIIDVNPLGKKFEYSNYNYNKFVPDKNVEKTVYKDEVESHWLVLGYKTTGAMNRKDVATLNVINSILGEGMSSRLFTKLREDKGLAYTVGSSFSANVLDGSWYAYIGAKPGHEQEAKEGILEEVETIKKEMVTTKELNENKDKILGKFLLAIETNMDEAGLLSHYGILGKDLNAFEEYKKLITEINQNDIIEVANKYFSKPYIYTVVKKK